ncbi:MAG: hypothetical protein KJ737_20670 [Proteobacteria bacterium]|nr:hypothetical protein [Pseudomonadota bacterium]
MQPIEIPQEVLEDLHKKRIECFEVTEQAILNNPGTFREIKRRLLRISYEPIDIDEYFLTACRLARLLKKMGPETIFTTYFHENIDPNLKGKACFFRTECKNLLKQIEELNNWRKSKRKLVLI